MSAAGKIANQLPPRDHDAQERFNARVTCRSWIRRTGGTPHDLLELYRELGLAHDPLALDRDPCSGTIGRYQLRGEAR